MEDDVAEMWDARAEGGALGCARCGGCVALATTELAYRFCCVACGWPSIWFTVRDGVVRAYRAMALRYAAQDCSNAAKRGGTG